MSSGSTNRKSPSSHSTAAVARYHPYTQPMVSNHIEEAAAAVAEGTYSSSGANAQFYAPPNVATSYTYDQYGQQQQQFVYSAAQPAPQASISIDYSAAAAAAVATSMQYNPSNLYTDQSYYYAAQNAAAASFLMQQGHHQFDSSAMCAPNMHNFVTDNQSWVSQKQLKPNNYFNNLILVVL